MANRGFRRALAWHRRLEARVAAAIALLVALALGALLVATTKLVTDRSLGRAAADLAAARSAFNRLMAARADGLAARLQVITAQPVFRRWLADTPTAPDVGALTTTADDYLRQLNAEFCIVTTPNGAWMAMPGWGDRGEPSPSLESAIQAAANGDPHSSIAQVAGRLFLVVSTPARSDAATLGTVTAGLALDDNVARELSEITQSDVSLVAGSHLSGSSLQGDGRAHLVRLLESASVPSLQPALQQLGAAKYLSGAFPLMSAAGGQPAGQFVWLRDWASTEQFIDDLKRQFTRAGALVFVFALAGGLAFSTRMSRPLQDVAAAARDIAGSRNWMREVPVRGSSEAKTMATAFNEMSRSLRQWEEDSRARSVRDERLQQAQRMEAIGRLAGGVAHDFNNLLTSIIGFASLVRDSVQDDPLRTDIEEVLSAADRAAGLTRQLLAFSRRELVTSQIVALDQIVANMERMLRRLVGADITLSVVTPPKLWGVRADPRQIEQVLINLAVNGRDAMPRGGELRIEVSNADLDTAGAAMHPGLAPGRYVRLAVTDSGPGIEPGLVSHIFEPFFTTRAEGKGTGLGLATVYGIAMQHGGHVEVDSEVNRGTTFHVYFPRIDAAEPGLAVEDAALPIDQASETVLLVEDDDRVRGLVATVLRKKGYTVLEASRGDEALALAERHATPIHLLLSDVVMPGMSGRIVADRVIEARPATRVLLMSGYSEDAVQGGGKETAAIPFIQKPFSMEALAAKIREALNAN